MVIVIFFFFLRGWGGEGVKTLFRSFSCSDSGLFQSSLFWSGHFGMGHFSPFQGWVVLAQFWWDISTQIVVLIDYMKCVF